MRKFLLALSVLPSLAIASPHTIEKPKSIKPVVLIPVEKAQPIIKWDFTEYKVKGYNFTTLVNTIASQTHNSLATDLSNNGGKIAVFNNNVSSDSIKSNVDYWDFLMNSHGASSFSNNHTQGYVSEITYMKTPDGKSQEVLKPGTFTYGQNFSLDGYLYNDNKYISTNLFINVTSGSLMNVVIGETNDTIQTPSINSINIKSKINMPVNGSILVQIDKNKIALISPHI